MKKEIRTFITWVNSINVPEVECESLVEWLEMEDRAAMRRGGLIVARIAVGLGGFVCAGFLTGFVLASLPTPWTPAEYALVIAAMVLAGSVGAIVSVRLAFGSKGRSGLRSHRDADAMSAIAHLRNVHGYRGLRKELGEHGVMELNEGAQLFLRCRSILTTAPWISESPDDPWVEARNDLLRAMESAMERLTLYVVKKRPFVDIGPVLDEMRTASNDVQRMTARRASVSGGAGRDLRASLARMKELAAAEDELLRIRE